MKAAIHLADISWPFPRLGEALNMLVRKMGVSPRSEGTPAAPPGLAGSETLQEWLDAIAARLGFETEPIDAPYPEVELLLRRAGPALLRLPGTTEPRFLALISGRQRTVSVIAPNLRVHQVPLEQIRATLCQEHETPLLPTIERMLDRAAVPASKRARARAAMLRGPLSTKRVSDCWLLRLAPGEKWQHQAQQARLPHFLASLTAGHFGQYMLWLLSWYLIGKGAMQGRLDMGWLMAWALVLLCMVPFRMLVTWSSGQMAIRAGAILKQRLLYGVLRLEPEEIRHQGAGQFLGSVIESEAVESLALSGGFLGLVAGIELVFAGVVIGLGAGGWLHASLLLIWVALSFVIAGAYWRGREQWTGKRLGMTNNLVECMIGHRTRLAQEARERWHDGEDQAAEDYQAVSAKMDRCAAGLMAIVPRGWLVAGLAGLVPAFVFSAAPPTALALSLGGILLAFRALQRFATGLWHLTGATMAWKQVAPIVHAAARPEIGGSPGFVAEKRSRAAGVENQQSLLQARDLVFRHRDRGEPVLRGCNLSIQSGDRVLLEGPSGGGKSTLGSLLTGLRSPESGLLLLNGLDQQTLGSRNWRRRVASTPQFHENHVLTGTFAFNLLMGCRWPPREQDLKNSELLCAELGLGDLLQRMPAGLMQLVGETGWQLSHGEKSRLYIARALLQGADLIILDESFASLDPENLQRALHCVLAHSSTLLVIAHP
jgi:ATP-binding cassette, subfamily B, bacterial